MQRLLLIVSCLILVTACGESESDGGGGGTGGAGGVGGTGGTGGTPKEWGDAVLIETNNPGNPYGHAYGPQVAIDANGNAVAVWYQWGGTRTNIWSNRYTPSSGWGTAELIEADDSGDASEPQVAIDPNGNALAVWHQFDGTRTNIWSNRYTPSGGWGTAQLIETDDSGDASEPQVAIDPAGNAVAVWYQWGEWGDTRIYIWSNHFE
jgi:hypothetical protein